MHQIETPHIPHKQEQKYRATGTDDCSGNCPKTLHETVQNGANACELHGRNKAPNKKINPAKVRGYASQCDALLKAGEAIRTPDIHVGNVHAPLGKYRHSKYLRRARFDPQLIRQQLQCD